MNHKLYFALVSCFAVFHPFAAKALAQSSHIPSIDHIIVVEFENTDYKDASAQPTFASILKNGANLSNFFAETHPSQPNYLAMVGGETFGIKNDKNVTLDDRHLGDLIEEAGKTWKVYADGYPGNCFLGARSGRYARKHVPFLSFQNVQTSPSRCANIVEGQQIEADLADGTLPDFSLYIPDLSHDGHDTGVAFADKWLKDTFLPMLDNRLPRKTLVVFTFDEGTLSGDNHIYTAFYGEMVVKGSVYSQKVDHYGLLHTVEVGLGLGDLGKKDQSSSVITGIWK
jgi:hypothetical protein